MGKRSRQRAAVLVLQRRFALAGPEWPPSEALPNSDMNRWRGCRRASTGRPGSSGAVVAPDRGPAPRTGASPLEMGEGGPQKPGREMGCMGVEDPSHYLIGVLGGETAEQAVEVGTVVVDVDRDAHAALPHRTGDMLPPELFLNGGRVYALAPGRQDARSSSGVKWRVSSSPLTQQVNATPPTVRRSYRPGAALDECPRPPDRRPRPAGPAQAGAGSSLDAAPMNASTATGSK